jgi:hypothetical protein
MEEHEKMEVEFVRRLIHLSREFSGVPVAIRAQLMFSVVCSSAFGSGMRSLDLLVKILRDAWELQRSIVDGDAPDSDIVIAERPDGEVEVTTVQGRRDRGH